MGQRLNICQDARAGRGIAGRHFKHSVDIRRDFFGQHEPETKPVGPELLYKWDAWIKCGALCSEMESSTLFIVGSYLRARTGAVLLVVANQERAKKGLSNPQAHDMEIVYKTTIEAIKSLITMDKTQ